MRYDKLVRDNIPDIIRQTGREPVIHVADEEEYWKKLKEKLHEEVDEFEEKPDVFEMADILEVLEAIRIHQGIDPDVLKSVKAKQAEERGRFDKRIILEES